MKKLRAGRNKLINFILEITQIILVFLGVFSALMCACTSLELTFERRILLVVTLVAAVLFYGLFTVLETFRDSRFFMWPSSYGSGVCWKRAVLPSSTIILRNL